MAKCGYCPQAPIGVHKWFFKEPITKTADDTLVVNWTVSAKGIRLDGVNLIKDGGKSYMAKKLEPIIGIRVVKDIAFVITAVFVGIPKLCCKLGLHTWYYGDVIYTDKDNRMYYQKWCPYCEKTYRVYCDTGKQEKEDYDEVDTTVDDFDDNDAEDVEYSDYELIQLEVEEEIEEEESMDEDDDFLQELSKDFLFDEGLWDDE